MEEKNNEKKEMENNENSKTLEIEDDIDNDDDEDCDENLEKELTQRIKTAEISLNKMKRNFKELRIEEC